VRRKFVPDHRTPCTRVLGVFLYLKLDQVRAACSSAWVDTEKALQSYGSEQIRCGCGCGGTNGGVKGKDLRFRGVRVSLSKVSFCFYYVELGIS